MRVLREVGERGETAIDAVAELLQLSPARVRVAVRNYGDYPSEIDAELADAGAASESAENAWRAAQRVLP